MKLTRPVETTLWPLRKLAWKVEDKVLWPLSDALRSKRGPDGFRERRAWTRLFSRPAASAASIPAASAPSIPEPRSRRLPSLSLPRPRGLSLPRPRGRLSLPRPRGLRSAAKAHPSSRDRSLHKRGDVRLALATVTAAAGVGVAIAALTGPPGATQSDDPQPAVLAGAPPAAQPPPAPAETQAAGKRASTLEGVTPNFKPAEKARKAASKDAAASAAPAAAVNPLQNTNAKPSTISAAAANGPKALRTVRDFAGAFVLYEVGTSSPKIKKTFARTTTPSLAKALRDRPPRLPGAESVPRARVQNVILGERRGRTLDASVSLLRLGDLSELRLTLTLRRKAWAVSEVRG